MNQEFSSLLRKPEILGALAAGAALVMAGVVLASRRPKLKADKALAPWLEESREDRERFIGQMDRIRLELEADRLAPYRGEAFQMVLRVHNNTDMELSPVLMIYLSRCQAWYFNDPRMGRGRIEFELREFAKKTPPGGSHAYPISARLLNTTRPGDGAWISFAVKGLDKEISSNIVRVADR